MSSLIPSKMELDPQQKRKLTFSGWYLIVALGVIWVMQTYLAQQTEPKPVSYSEFLGLLDGGSIVEVELRANEIVAELAEGRARDNPSGLVVTQRLPGIDESPLLQRLQESRVKFSGRIEEISWWKQLLLGWLLPIGVLFGFWFFLVRRMGRGSGPLSFGKSKVKVYDRGQENPTTFKDVAGVDEAKGELTEILDFLVKPEKYNALGARVPKGVLLVGPPGAGKTLMARALAGEANVPFFSLSGSDFVEMFVGVGASRVRDLFAQAKERAPCIIFIDEIDAIGKSRGGLAAMATHDEREQTLNQLLSEMDGFDPSSGVIIMAATNRPEVLDQALLRAGRFDRQIIVDRPDVRGRKSILEVHSRELKLGSDVDFPVIAQRTPGMSGADLANVANEAALSAVRRGSHAVQQQDFDNAVDRIQLGVKTVSRVMTPEEKRRVAFHESGHALVAMSVENADPVYKVTIIPSSVGALGATLQLPTEDRYLVTRNELRDRICVMLGGRAAEEVCCQDVSSGAHNDLERATETARQMVTRFGMSEKLGPRTFGTPAGMRFLESPIGLGTERNYSEEAARTIDEEVREIIEAEYKRASKIVGERREVLKQMVDRLLTEETLQREALEELVGTLPSRTSSCPT